MGLRLRNFKKSGMNRPTLILAKSYGTQQAIHYTMSESDPLLGTRIHNYILLKLVGRGAMGSVYLARHMESGQQVAIKFLSGEFSQKKEFVTRFVNEASSAVSVEHKHIIRVLESGQDDDLHFIVMEFIDGVDLAHFLEVQDKVKEVQALPWLKQAALGLGFAHSQGIVHRDLKPENIMLTREGVVKVADLGLSKNLGASEDASMTLSGTVIGTPYYISPEQARDAKHVDARTDIYSLGATFYHLVTGSPPFPGTSAAEIMSKHMSEALTSPQRRNSSLSDGFSEILLKMMAKEPTNRFQTMEELVLTIERLEKGEKVLTNKIRLKNADLVHEASKSTPLLRRGIRRTLKRVFIVAGLITVAFLILSKPSQPKNSLKSPVNATTGVQTVPSIPQTTDSGTHATPRETPIVTTTPSTPKPTEGSAPGISVVETDEGISFTGTQTAVPVHLPGALNWMDSLLVVGLFVGIPLARQVGLMWGSVRAVLFWLALVGSCTWFVVVGETLNRALSIPGPLSQFTGFLVVSVVLMGLTIVLTHKLQGHKKQNLSNRFGDFASILPGAVMGVAVGVWAIAFVTLVAPNGLPLKESWTGAQLFSTYPALEIASHRTEPLLDTKDTNYYATPPKK